MKKIKQILVLLFGTIFIIGACSIQDHSTETAANNNRSEQIHIVTTLFPVYEITRAIVGDAAELSLMVGASEDAHHYEPSAQGVTSVNEADVFIYSSDVMEFWVDSILAVTENDALEIINLSTGLDLTIAEREAELDHDHNHNHDEEHDHNHGEQDPHFWLDPVAVHQQIAVITDTLSAVDPENADQYKTNAAAFSAELLTLHEAYEEAFAEAVSREFVVQHQAFGHLAKRYELEQVAVSGLQTEIEPSPQRMVEIIEFVNEQNVPVIYYQSGESSAVATTIANETNTDIAILYDLEQPPAFAEEDATDNIYLQTMYHNLDELKKSIQ